MKSINEEISALNRSDLPPRAKALYLALMELADSGAKCTAILASLVFKSGMSVSSVIRATKELEKSGFISVFRFDKRGPNTLPNIYTLIHRTEQSCQNDSTCPGKLTGKNNTITTSSTSACHHDSGGAAPDVMGDRLKEYIKIQDILKKYEGHTDFEIESIAFDVVELVGLQGLEAALLKRKTVQSPRRVQLDLEDVIWEQRNASRETNEVA
ncbi:helix-turn-helix domain-containing protein [Pseudomonadota bacterium]